MGWLVGVVGCLAWLGWVWVGLVRLGWVGWLWVSWVWLGGGGLANPKKKPCNPPKKTTSKNKTYQP